MQNRTLLRLILAVGLTLLCCRQTPTTTRAAETAAKAGAIEITSPAFADHKSIPAIYTCDGQDAVPPLRFANVPAAARSLALIVDDPDAPVGTWVHWVVWNIPPGTKAIGEGSPPAGTVGQNSWPKNAYGGPCPPSGEHRYFFKVYALDTMLDLPATVGKEKLLDAMKNHVIDRGELVGVYARQRPAR